MTGEQTVSTFPARLRATLGNLLLALLNATLLLFILAAICGLLLIGKVRSLSADVAGEMSRAAVSATGLDPAAALGELQALRTEVVDLRQALAARREDVAPVAERLEARLDRVEAVLDEIRERRFELSDRTVNRLSEAASRFMREARDCRPGENASP